MAEVAQAARRPHDINAVTSWLAAQPVPADSQPAAAPPRPPADRLRRRCATAGSAAMRRRFFLLRLRWRRAALVLSRRGRRGAEPARRGSAARRHAPRPGHAERGAGRARRYLARAGNCAGCHTDARRRAVCRRARHRDAVRHRVRAATSRPTRRPASAAGRAAHFWRALHNGRSRDGRLLYPAFPYPNYTRVTREPMPTRCSPTCAAWRRSRSRTCRTQLRFPYNTQAALAVWRALFFRPGGFEPTSRRSRPNGTAAPTWCEGLGHCNACHARRNALGATSDTLGPLAAG